MILLVYLGHVMFHPLEALFLRKSDFGRGLKFPNGGTQQKEWFTYIEARVNSISRRPAAHRTPAKIVGAPCFFGAFV